MRSKGVHVTHRRHGMIFPVGMGAVVSSFRRQNDVTSGTVGPTGSFMGVIVEWGGSTALRPPYSPKECPLCPGHFHDTARCPEVCGSCDVGLRNAAMDLDDVVSAFQSAFDDENDKEFARLCHQHDQPLVRDDPDPFTYPVEHDVGLRAHYAGLSRGASDTGMGDVLADARGVCWTPCGLRLQYGCTGRLDSVTVARPFGVLPACEDTSLNLCSIDTSHDPIHLVELSVIDDDDSSDGYSHHGDEIPSAPPATRSRVGVATLPRVFSFASLALPALMCLACVSAVQGSVVLDRAADFTAAVHPTGVTANSLSALPCTFAFGFPFTFVVSADLDSDFHISGFLNLLYEPCSGFWFWFLVSGLWSLDSGCWTLVLDYDLWTLVLVEHL
ncbi:hypothetical protein CYMTET_47474 [Cymbomonas tetramitiformis]|uniref:Uncharacterized protein n=1 Tax=Cymbomonas tetramitiformis TaxID=36881 RepID=A0AAE0EW54_9CHLO|nr:hypothetical protein CYMTET_47474 [Cymbomonas tetramitiformis]